MYVPAHFEASEADALITRLSQRWAGVLISVGADGTPVGTHLPILWDGEKKIVTGHIARANPHHKLGAGRGLIVLSGAEAYVSPSFYPSKAEHGKAVPTWNYEAVHLGGVVAWFEEPARLEAVVRELSQRHERARAEPWSIDDAPREYINAMLCGIIGVEMRVDRIEAKRKLSQNKGAADFAGVVDGLSIEDDSMAREIAEQMREIGK
jgi:transcriptional regulator